MNNTIQFGTDGIRGNANKYPFTNKALVSLGIALSQWGIKKYKKNNLKILLGHDTRISCEKIKENLINGLQLFPIEILDSKILPTPAICQLTLLKKYKIDFGIIISASHNPYHDNGIKIIDSLTGKLEKRDEKIISKLYEKTFKNFSSIKLQINGNKKNWLKAAETYKENLAIFFDTNFLKNKKVVLDCSNGATYKIAPKIFSYFGADVIAISNKPNGKNINHKCGSLHPENLQNTILKHKADIGFAFDGDGDRVIAINKNGKIIDGDEIIAILSEHPQLKNQEKIVGTVMTNLGLHFHLKKRNIKLIRTKVGDKYVATKLLKNNLLLGGESSGHIIMRDYMNTGDGIFTALRLIETAILTNNINLKTFHKTPQLLINIPIDQKKDLKEKPYAQIIKKQKNILKHGRIIVRYSGTENLLRIMTEDKNEQLTKQVANILAQELQQALKAIF